MEITLNIKKHFNSYYKFICVSTNMFFDEGTELNINQVLEIKQLMKWYFFISVSKSWI